MAAPLFKVEVAFADGPNAAAPTYTDISQYVRREPPLQWQRGNADEVQQLQAGTMSFAVDNSNGRFTPGSSASTSAWGTTLKIRRPVRLSLWNGTSYVVTWTGTVDDWGTGWVNGVQGRTLVTCSDAVAAAGRIDLSAALEAEMLYDGALAVFPLREPAGSTVATDSAAGATLAGALPPRSLGADLYAFGGGTAPGPDGGGMLTFTPVDSATGAWFSGTVSALSSLAARTYEFWVQAPLPTWQQKVLVHSDFNVQLDTGGTLSILRLSTVTTVTSTKVVADDLLHHVAITITSGGGNVTTKIYIDGALDTTDVKVQSAPSTGTSLTIGSGGSINSVGGAYSHFGFYLGALADARILDHYNAATAWTGETIDARWDRLCRIAGLGSTTYAADASTGTVGTLPTEGRTLASLLQTLADQEQGSAYCTTGGVLTLKARSNRYDKASTLTIAPQTVERNLDFVTNDAYLVNDATVTAATGATGRSISSTSVTDYGPVRHRLDIPADTLEQALNLAQWQTYRYSEPGTRARSFSVNATTKAASVTTTALLALDVDSRITLSPLPNPAPASSVQLFIDGVGGSVGDELVFTYNTSPTTNLDGWILGTDTLDTGTLLLY